MRLVSSPCFQLPGTKRQPRRAGFVTAQPLALFFATRLFKPSRAAFSAPPPAGAGCTGSYWSGSGRPTAAPIPAPWPGITACLPPQLPPARPRNELIRCRFILARDADAGHDDLRRGLKAHVVMTLRGASGGGLGQSSPRLRVAPPELRSGGGRICARAVSLPAMVWWASRGRRPARLRD